jgi:hypothetical protein
MAINKKALVLNTTTGNLQQLQAGDWIDGLHIGTDIQAYDAGLAAFAAKSTTGILVQTGADTYASRALVAPLSGITISNADGVAGNPTLALSDDLAAIEGLATVGFAVRVNESTWTTASIVTGSSARITVANGDGTTGSPTIDLATVTPATSGTFQKFTTDAYGRIAGVTAVTTGDITALVDATYVNATGDTMTGTLTFTSGTVTGLAAPVAASDAATKAYVDAVASSLNVHGAVEVATTAPLAGTVVYANGTLGVGATLSGFTDITVDGYTLVAGVEGTGTRVLVKNQAAALQNGIYYYSAAGVLTRASDSNNHIAGQVTPGDYVFVSEGTTQAATGWSQTAIGTGTGEAIIIGTNAIAFTQFSGAGTYHAGVGIDLTGTTFSVKLGAGVANLPTGEVGIDLFSPTSGALILTDNGTSRATDTASQLHLLLATNGGLTQDATGLYIPALGVTNAMLASHSITLDAGTGTTVKSLGDTLYFMGDSTSGIITAIVNVAGNDEVIISASPASTTQRGTASFNTSHFSVTAGAVSLAASLGKLTNVSPSVDGAAAGDLLSFVGGVWTHVTQASVVPSMDLNALTDTTITAVSTGDVLFYNGTQWVNGARGSVSGVQAYSAQLNGLSALTGTGLVVQTGAGTFANGAIVGTAGQIAVAGGTTATPTISLVATAVVPGTYNSVTVDAFGRVTAATIAPIANDNNTLAIDTSATTVAKAVYVSGAGLVADAVNTVATEVEVAGFTSIVGSGTAGQIITSGTAYGFTGLTPGVRYFLDATAGGITSVVPSVGYICAVGVAATATSLIVNIATPIQL